MFVQTLQFTVLRFAYGDGSFLSIVQIGQLLGTDVTPLQVFQLRNVCSVARLRYSKKICSMQNSIHIETFLFQKKKGSSHLSKILSNRVPLGIPHNKNKFANNMDVIISGEQAKFLNSFPQQHTRVQQFSGTFCQRPFSPLYFLWYYSLSRTEPWNACKFIFWLPKRHSIIGECVSKNH